MDKTHRGPARVTSSPYVDCTRPGGVEITEVGPRMEGWSSPGRQNQAQHGRASLPQHAYTFAPRLVAAAPCASPLPRAAFSFPQRLNCRTP